MAPPARTTPAPTGATTAPAGDRPLYLRVGLAVPCADGAEPIEHAAVLVERGRISVIGAEASIPMPEGAEVVEALDATLLPGLVDAHVHLMFRVGENIHEHARRFDDHQLLVRAAHHARLLVQAGVTTVRDCGSRGTFLAALRDGIAAGHLPGPRLLVCGPPITTTAGHLWPYGGEADSADEARRLVRRLVKERVDFIKVMATGGRMTPGTTVGLRQFSADELRAIVADAHRLGRHVAAHCLGTDGIAAAVEAGVDTIEHGNWLDPSGDAVQFDEHVARQMAERGIYRNMATVPDRELAELTPDAPLTPAQQARLSAAEERWRWFRRGIELGIPSFFSTDAIFGQWPDACPDLAWLAVSVSERGGIAPADALRMVTAIPARAIGLGNETGALTPGLAADLLLVRGNPLRSLRALLNVQAVFRAGVRVA